MLQPGRQQMTIQYGAEKARFACRVTKGKNTDTHSRWHALMHNWLIPSIHPNGTTTRGGPRPPSRVSSTLPGLGRLLSSFYTLALLHLPSLHLPSTTWVSHWDAFLLAHWGRLSWINHRHPGLWHVLPISTCSNCRISQCHSHHTTDTVLG